MKKFVALAVFLASGSVFAGDVDAQGPVDLINNRVVSDYLETGENVSRLSTEQERFEDVVAELDSELRKDLDAIIEKEISMRLKLDRYYQDRVRTLSTPTYVVL